MISSNKVKNLVSKAFGSGNLSRDKINYAVKCPACNESNKSKKKLVVRLDDGRYHCWVCGLKGKNIVSLIKKYSPEIQGISDLKFKTADIKEQEKLILPENFVVLSEYSGKDPDILSTINYLKSRNVSSFDIGRWRILAYKSGRFRRRVVIPSFDDTGNLNYFIARTIDDIKPKYRNAHAKKSDIIFNEIDIDWSKPVILVEGIFDALKSPENSIPILGSTLPPGSLLFERLVSNQCEVFLSLDPDMKSKAYDIAKSLSRMGCSVYISFANPGNDIGQLTKAEARKLLSSSVPYRSEESLYYKIGKIRSGSVI